MTQFFLTIFYGKEEHMNYDKAGVYFAVMKWESKCEDYTYGN